jgi:hypothetical protein
MQAKRMPLVQGRGFLRIETERRIRMKQLMIAALVAVATFAVTTAVLRSHQPTAFHAAGMSSGEINPPAAKAPLPVEVFDDMTFVSPPAKKE